MKTNLPDAQTFVSRLRFEFPVSKEPDPNGNLLAGKVWKERGGMHLPVPSKNKLIGTERYYFRGRHRGERYELQLDSGILKGHGAHAVLLIRFIDLHKGPENQATLMVRSTNVDSNGYFIRYAGKPGRRARITRGIDAFAKRGGKVRRWKNRVYFGDLANSQLLLDMVLVAARAIAGYPPSIPSANQPP